MVGDNLKRNLFGNIYVDGNSVLWNPSKLNIGEKIKTKSYVIAGMRTTLAITEGTQSVTLLKNSGPAVEPMK